MCQTVWGFMVGGRDKSLPKLPCIPLTFHANSKFNFILVRQKDLNEECNPLFFHATYVVYAALYFCYTACLL